MPSLRSDATLDRQFGRQTLDLDYVRNNLNAKPKATIGRLIGFRSESPISPMPLRSKKPEADVGSWKSRHLCFHRNHYALAEPPEPCPKLEYPKALPVNPKAVASNISNTYRRSPCYFPVTCTLMYSARYTKTKSYMLRLLHCTRSFGRSTSGRTSPWTSSSRCAKPTKTAARLSPLTVLNFLGLSWGLAS